MDIRKDVVTDRKQSHCANSTLLGFSSFTAKFGDLVLFDQDNGVGREHATYIARVIGRIAEAPERELCGHIVVCVLSDDMSFMMERWIKPEQVIRVIPQSQIPEVRQVVTAFLSDDVLKFKPDILRQWVASGWHTLTRFLESIQPRI